MRPLSAVHLPAIRDTLADNARSRHRAFRAAERDGTLVYPAHPEDRATLARGLWDDGSALRHATLWWVTRDMAALAAHTAADSEVMPEWSILKDCAHRSGLIVWDGGLPDRVPWLPSEDSRVEDAIPIAIDGVQWYVSDGELKMSYYTADPRVTANYALAPWTTWRAPLIDIDVSGRNLAMDATIERVIAATMLLSEQPTVASVRAASWQLDTTGKSAQRAKEVPAVKVVALREVVDKDTREQADGGTSDPREYTHRWIVRDHERTYWTGPGSTVPVKKWIPPYVAGPADKPLVVKDQVRIWRR